MIRELLIPSRNADPTKWCQWAWLVGRMERHEHLPALREIIFDTDFDQLVRQTALSSYWFLSNVQDAIQVEEDLLGQVEVGLALMGLHHPRWWHESLWLDSCQGWLGQHSILDQAITMVLSWGHHPMSYARVPREVRTRVGIPLASPMDWLKIFQTGWNHAVNQQLSGFEEFWRVHGTDWAERWFRWEEAIWRYRWRLEEEQRLVEWTHSKAYAAHVPDAPAVEAVLLPHPECAKDSLALMTLGLGYQTGAEKSQKTAAAWDSIWSSWSASLNYTLFETLNNVQITEWHIAGLTATLRNAFSGHST